MSTESSPDIPKTGKSKVRRAHRASRKQPVLVIPQESDDQPQQAVATVAVEEKSSTAEQPSRRGKPKFFANINQTEESRNQPEADPKSVRLARALRGTFGKASQEVPVKEKKQPAKVVPARPGSSSGFKMRYIWGMVMYLLIADFLGVEITNIMQANHLDTILFVLGPIRGTTSTLIFLAILVVILVVMARFDLLPRSFSAMGGSNSTTRGSASRSSKTKDAATFETKASQPKIRQGVQGEDDDLYKEYRKNQRYFQRRDRKR
jgi:hypothetical protein